MLLMVNMAQTEAEMDRFANDSPQARKIREEAEKIKVNCNQSEMFLMLMLEMAHAKIEELQKAPGYQEGYRAAIKDVIAKAKEDESISKEFLIWLAEKL